MTMKRSQVPFGSPSLSEARRVAEEQRDVVAVGLRRASGSRPSGRAPRPCSCRSLKPSGTTRVLGERLQVCRATRERWLSGGARRSAVVPTLERVARASARTCAARPRPGCRSREELVGVARAAGAGSGTSRIAVSEPRRAFADRLLEVRARDVGERVERRSRGSPNSSPCCSPTGATSRPRGSRRKKRPKSRLRVGDVAQHRDRVLRPAGRARRSPR